MSESEQGWLITVLSIGGAVIVFLAFYIAYLYARLTTAETVIGHLMEELEKEGELK